MKKILFTVLMIVIITSSGFFAQNKINSNSRGAESCAARKQSVYGNSAFSPSSYIPHAFDVQNYKLYLDIYNCFLSPYPKSYTANEIITLRVDSVLSSISLNAVSTSLTIDSVSLAGTSFTHTNDILTIKLNRAYQAGELVDVKIYYKHKDVTDGAFYVRSGMVFTDCEPEGARKWYPCWDKPSDKATFDIKAKVPATVKLGSNGRLADSVKSADTIYYNWISRDPLSTYLAVISAKVGYNLDIVYWHKISNPNDSIPIRFYWNTGESTSNLALMEKNIIAMTTQYSTLFGEHPYEKNGFATLNSDFAWGGMENQTLTSLCPNCWSDNLISHEFAHQWFGDMITCATWADIWMNEGFATYCEALWSEYSGGYAAYKNAIINDATEYMSSNPGWAIYNPSWAVVTPNTNTLFNTAITYDKGGCVLHMLRYVLGDQMFFNVLKSYATDTDNFKFKNVLTADFITKVNKVSGQDMSWFFNQWIYQPNHPSYKNTYYMGAIPNNAWQVGFIATQTNSYFYKMPIELKITFSDGKDTLIRVMNDMNNQQFVFNFGKQPASVQFDPNNNIVLKTASLSNIPFVPVELVSFTAEQRNNNIILKWKTATETNNKGFEIQKSVINNSNLKERLWQSIGFVQGNGTTTNICEYTFKDIIPTTVSFVYRLKQIDYDGTYKYSNEINAGAMAAPEKYLLSQNYPNPFNPSTSISYKVPVGSFVTLKVYDALGKVVATLVEKELPAGTYEAKIDGSNLASGIYFYKLQAGAYTDFKKAMLLK